MKHFGKDIRGINVHSFVKVFCVGLSDFLDDVSTDTELQEKLQAASEAWFHQWEWE
jgi:hypothetical protein